MVHFDETFHYMGRIGHALKEGVKSSVRGVIQDTKAGAGGAVVGCVLGQNIAANTIHRTGSSARWGNPVERAIGCVGGALGGAGTAVNVISNENFVSGFRQGWSEYGDF